MEPQRQQQTTQPNPQFVKDMSHIAHKNFAKPDEVRNIPYGKIELVNVGGMTVGKVTLQPGWRWSTSVKPIAKTESCQALHYSYQISGTLRTRMDDGNEMEFKAGDIAVIPPGHDSWVVGDEPVVVIDFQGMAQFALPPHKH